MKFATYLYPEIFETLKPFEEIQFEGYSFPHYNTIRKSLEKHLDKYPKLPLRKTDFNLYYAVHNQNFIDDILLLSQDKEPSEPLNCTIECAGMEFAVPGYCYCLGGMIEAIEQGMDRKLQRAYLFNVGGHHAHSHYAHGYSLLNTMAAAIRYGQANGLGNVLIVDWDIHHGDGTQQIFDDDHTVHQISIHSAVGLYMLGASNIEQGTTTYAESIGHCNIPVLWDGYDDNFFEEIKLPGKFFRAGHIMQELKSALSRVPFVPDLVFIFSGYDGHVDDCGEGITNYTNDDFRKLTRIVLDYAASRKLPVISVHGGGYASPVDITINAALAHVAELVNYP